MYNEEHYPVVFSTIAGSRLYGIHNENSDYDYIQACIEPPNVLLGFEHFEQENWSHPDKQSEGVIYSLRKFVKLVVQGNPTHLCAAFNPHAADSVGIRSEEFRSHLNPATAGSKFMGYVRSQMKEVHKHGNRPSHKAYVDKYGFDTKYASYMIMYALLGIEYLQHTKMRLPMPPNSIDLIRSIREGKLSLLEVEGIAENLLEVLAASFDASQSTNIDMEFFSNWLSKRYLEQWRNREFFVMKNDTILLDADMWKLANEAEKGYEIGSD